ncbi:Holo-[acyl-carrier-protein] synthase [hydrothermal vent metagenome]|uniref:Holo-[acyl-carrier-protein] synthase n=1 Tax=hydrothermal vent metagenome TaxID=652676 RepID=A0A3B0RD23_9ZZZZ
MMRVIGLGNDLVNIDRIDQSISKYGQRFIDRIFTPVEQEYCDGKAARVSNYAKRFAAKEACAKALGTGFARGVFWRDVGVERAEGGKPCFRLTGGALIRLQEITPGGMTAQLDLTLTDDHPWAQAVVLITAIPLHLVDNV